MIGNWRYKPLAFAFLAFAALVTLSLLMIPSLRAQFTKEDGLLRGSFASSSARETALIETIKPILTPQLKRQNLRWGAPIFLRAFKEEQTLEVWIRKKDGTFALFKNYPVLATSGTLGPKLAEGDRQIPEGFYAVGPKQMNPKSRFHFAFNIGYPNQFDQSHRRTGSFIMVHGSNVSIGCLAIGDDKIEEVYALAKAAFQAGQPYFRIHIFPFRMNEKNMARHSGHKHFPFWKNLKEGYHWFEREKTPPNVTVKNRTYSFTSSL